MLFQWLLKSLGCHSLVIVQKLLKKMVVLKASIKERLVIGKICIYEIKDIKKTLEI